MRNGAVLALLLLLSQASPCANWFPQPMMADGKPIEYAPLDRARHRWRLCALLPHGKDHFFWAVAYGLRQEAQRSGVDIGVYEAGGYEHASTQLQQLAACEALQADAYLIAAIAPSSLKPDLARLMASGKPVIDLVNGLPTESATAHSTDIFAELARVAATCILRDARGRKVSVAWLPGPQGAIWVDQFGQGMRETFRGTNVTVLANGYGATDMSTQMTLVRNILEHEQVDYLLGNAMAAEAASRYLQTRPQLKTQIVSIYGSEAVVSLIREGRVLCAASDAPVLQSRIAVDLAVRALEQRLDHRVISPVIELIDKNSVNHLELDRLFAPEGTGFLRNDLAPLR